MAEPILYHTDGCHLCDQAAQLLDRLGGGYRRIDIVDSEELVERYGVRIPVVRRPDGAEQGWPFDLAELQRFLEDS
ncbi:glutaredoxin family protein [Ferrimonas sediminicola]|uniref:Glutaredoxin family protein n=1 Tax=Ferrimonas sediminicola TaxID=2569538 RepID=A0A4U1BHB9_9GAMM|nr:glutaredoxin family protein [Ferrimonas sediminicola]TKB50427.1 glutaredoxin family protein [Ferrimonas sediminicola]